MTYDLFYVVFHVRRYDLSSILYNRNNTKHDQNVVPLSLHLLLQNAKRKKHQQATSKNDVRHTIRKYYCLPERVHTTYVIQKIGHVRQYQFLHLSCLLYSFLSLLVAVVCCLCCFLPCFLFCCFCCRLSYLVSPAATASLALLLVCWFCCRLSYGTVFSCWLSTASRHSSLHSLSSPSSILFSLLTFTFDYYFVASKSISVLINKFTYRTTLHQRHTKEWLAATSSDNDSRSAKKNVFSYIIFCKNKSNESNKSMHSCTNIESRKSHTKNSESN